MKLLARLLACFRGLPNTAPDPAELRPAYPATLLGDYISPARGVTVRHPVCPLCNGNLRRLANDLENRWQCETAGCWFHSTPVPQKVALGLQTHTEN
jgi:hypothetical protein